MEAEEPKKKRHIESPVFEITLRKYEKPQAGITRRELVKRICLSLGLLNPGDSRDVIIDVMNVILDSKRALTAKEIIKRAESQREELRLSDIGVTYPNISRLLRKLKAYMIIESRADKYRLSENSSLKDIFNEKIIRYHLESINGRINEYLDMLTKTGEENDKTEEKTAR